MIEKFKNKKWYRQGGLIVPFFECPAMLTISEILGEGNYIGIYRGDKNHGYFNTEILKKFAYEEIAKQLADINYINTLYDKWKVFADKSLELIKNNADIKELIPVLEDFWRTAWVIEYYDPYGDEIAKKYLKLNDNDRAIVLSPLNMPTVQQEDLDLIKMKKEGRTDFISHQKKYYFIKASWALAPEYSIDEIKEKYNEIEDPDEEIKKIQDHYKNTLEKKKELKQNLSEKELKIVAFFEKLTDWRDERKVFVQKANCYLHKYLEQLEKEHNIPVETLRFLNVYDMTIDKELLEKRATKCVDLMENNKWTIKIGDEANKLAELIEKEFSGNEKELKGTTACLGKVTGKVTVIRGSEDFKDFQDGDVLVAASTRPEFAPLMKKSIAIVTDEGGVTSHAAIVSRELNIPCVIGTQKATSILKKGMTVEVDADNGIVKIIE